MWVSSFYNSDHSLRNENHRRFICRLPPPRTRCKFTKKNILDKMNHNISHIYMPIPPREETCEVSLLCDPADYSASRIAHAVEDADAHLLELHTDFTPDGELSIRLRISHTDPTSVERSLLRYGYTPQSPNHPITQSPNHPLPSYLQTLLEV